MKTKKILALIVALAMIIAVVPSIGLAAVEDGEALSDELVLALAKVMDPAFDSLNPAPHAASDTDLSAAWDGWSGEGNGNYINVAGGTSTPRIQAYRGDSTNGTQPASKVITPGYGAGNEYVVLSFIAEHTAAWGDVALMDIDGAYITAFRTGNGGLNVGWGHTGWGTPYSIATEREGYTIENDVTTTTKSGSTKVDILIRAVSEEQYTATYFVDGAIVTTATYPGSFNGLGSIQMARGSGNAWQRIALQQPTIYVGDVPTETNEATVKLALKDVSAASMAKKSIELVDTAEDIFGTELAITWESSDPAVIAEDGTVTPDANEFKKVALTPTATFGEDETVTGAAQTVTVFPAPLTEYEVENGTVAKVGATNLLDAYVNSDFSGDDWGKGWTTGAGSLVDGKFTRYTVGDVNYIKANADGGAASDAALVTVINDILKPGTTYIATVIANNVPDGSKEWRRLYNDAVGDSNNSPVAFTNLGGINSWERKVYKFDAVNADIKYNLTWLQSVSEFAEFGIYELTLNEEDSKPYTDVINDKTEEGLKSDGMAKGVEAQLELENQVTVNEEPVDVKWVSSNQTIVTNDGKVTPTMDVETVKITPIVTVDGVAVKGEPRTVTVFPKALNTEDYTTETAVYTVGDDNLIGSFDGPAKTDVTFEGWTDGTGAALGESTGFEYVTEGNVTYIKVKGYNSKTSNDKSPQALKGKVTGLDAEKTYVLALTSKGIDGTYAKIDTGNDEYAPFHSTSAWERQDTIITGAEEISICFRWCNASYESFELYELEQQPEDIAKLDAVPDVTVIDGNTVKLPEVVDGYGTLGSRMYDIELAWNEPDEYKAGETVAVNGYAVDNEDVTIEVNVTVLPCTDASLAEEELKEYGQKDGSAEANHKLGEAFTGKAAVEFDVTYTVAPTSNDFIGFGNGAGHGNKPAFGSSAFSIQGQSSGNTAMIAAQGNGSKWSKKAAIELNQPYRVLFETDTNAKTFTVTITAPNGKVLVKSDELSYRDQGATTIDSIHVLYNDGTAKENANRASVTNLRISWADSDNYKMVAVQYVDENDEEIVTTDAVQYMIGDTIVLAESRVYANEKIYTLPAVEDEVTDETPAVVKKVATVSEEYAAKTDVYIQDNAAHDNEAANQVFVGVSGGEYARDKDEDGNATYTTGATMGHLGNDRVAIFTFNKPEVEDNQQVLLKVFVANVNENVSNTAASGIKLYAAKYDGAADGSVSAKEIIKGLSDVAWSDVYAKPVANSAKNSGKYPSNMWLTMDVTDIVAASDDEVAIAVTAGHCGAYIAQTESAVYGGAYQGNAAYLDVVDGVKVTVDGAAEDALITKNGSKVTAPFVAQPGDAVRVYSGAAYTSGLAYTIADGAEAADGVVTIGETDAALTVIPAIKAVLGWNDEEFTIDFVFEGFGRKDGVEYGIEITADDDEEVLLKGALAADAAGIGLITATSNVIYTAVPTIKMGDNVVKGKAIEGESIYSLVMAAIAASDFEGKIEEVQLAAVNAVLKNGGIFVDAEGNLTKETALVMTKTDNKIELTAKAIERGLVLTVDTGVHDTNGTYVAIVDNGDGTFTLTDVDGQTVLVLSLESVNLEFVPTEVAEAEAGGADADLDFTPEL